MNIRFNILRLLFCILIISNIVQLQASNYNNSTLEIISKIIPRFVLMSSQKDKLDKSINICILYENSDKNFSNSLISKIRRNNPNGINNFSIKFEKTNFTNIDKCKNTHLSFIFNTNNQNIKKTLDTLNKYKILTMSYDNKYLKNGVGISLFIGRKVTPYLNIKAIYSNNIQIDNILLRVSKIYKEEKE